MTPLLDLPAVRQRVRPMSVESNGLSPEGESSIPPRGHHTLLGSKFSTTRSWSPGTISPFAPLVSSSREPRSERKCCASVRDAGGALFIPFTTRFFGRGSICCGSSARRGVPARRENSPPRRESAIKRRRHCCHMLPSQKICGKCRYLFLRTGDPVAISFAI